MSTVGNFSPRKSLLDIELISEITFTQRAYSGSEARYAVADFEAPESRLKLVSWPAGRPQW